MFSILFGNKVNLFGYVIAVPDYKTMINLLSVKQFSQKFVIEKDKIEISFDNENNFFLSKQLDNTDKVLLYLLNQGIRDGGYFLDEKHDIEMQYNKTIKII